MHLVRSSLIETSHVIFLQTSNPCSLPAGTVTPPIMEHLGHTGRSGRTMVR